MQKLYGLRQEELGSDDEPPERGKHEKKMEKLY